MLFPVAEVMRSLSDNLLKSSWVVVKNEGTRVIDSNERIADRLQKLTEIMEMQERSSDDFQEGFTEGLDVIQMEQLLADPDNSGTAVNNEQIQAEANQILEDANAQAEGILSSANAEAKEVLNNARSEAESIRQDAKQAGYDEGFNQGYEEAMQKASEAEAMLAQKEQQLMQSYENMINELEPQFVDAITRIYERVFHLNLSEKKEIVLFLLQDAIRGIDGGKNFLLHVSSADFQYVNENKETLEQLLAANCTLEIIEDMTLSETECFVEAEGGIFDCSLGTELENLKKELVLLSHTKG